ncbi:hypothetical protein [Defluviimonas sp. WL0075]|uniref:hypothetical protein n=1 Tax=Albidovulum sediminicola TaxID=2984331 RepID=UPI0021E6E309|nr:hypothetical protein [Defluviimonas sp. WL0075]
MAIDLECWLDVLEVYSDEEIRRAWAEYQRSGPRSARGVLYKPDPGALYQIIERNRAPAREAEYRKMMESIKTEEAQAEAERRASLPTYERAKEILREVAAAKTDKPDGDV